MNNYTRVSTPLQEIYSNSLYSDMFRLATTVLPRHVFHLPVEMLYHTRLPVPERLTDAADDAYVGGMFSVQPDDAQSYDVTCQLLLTQCQPIFTLTIYSTTAETHYTIKYILFFHFTLRFQQWIGHFQLRK